MIWMQQWADVLQLHFAVPAGELRGRVPPRLDIDTFDGQAWLSLVLFHLKLRPAWMPLVPGFSSLLELNVRTYVRFRGQSGIYFLRMFANNRLAIGAARLLTPLGYEFAAMSDRPNDHGGRHVDCLPAGGGGLSVDLISGRDFAEMPPGSLDFWLLERYRLFVGRRNGAIVAADVEHPPWRAAAVETSTVNHDLGKMLGLSLAISPALVHESPGLRARFKAFVVVAEPCRNGLRDSRDVTPAHAAARRDGR